MTATDNGRQMQGAPRMPRAQQIAETNDAFRAGKAPGRFFVTPGIIKLTEGSPDELIALVRNFEAFNDDNDPYGEHDFGALEWRGQRIFWKIECFDLQLQYASPDPTDASVSQLLLTVLLASEY